MSFYEDPPVDEESLNSTVTTSQILKGACYSGACYTETDDQTDQTILSAELSSRIPQVDSDISLQEENEKLKERCRQLEKHAQKMKKNAETAAQHGLALLTEKEQFEANVKDVIQKKDEEINRLKKNAEEQDLRIGRLQTGCLNDGIQKKIRSNDDGEDEQIVQAIPWKAWLKTELNEDYAGDDIQAFDKLKSKIASEREQFKSTEIKFASLEEKYKVLEKQVPIRRQKDNLNQIKRLLGNLGNNQEVAGNEAENEAVQMKLAQIQEELRKERDARRHLEVEKSKAWLRESLIRKQTTPITSKTQLYIPENEARSSTGDCDNEIEKTLIYTPYSDRGSFSCVENELDQYKSIIKDRDQKMVEKKYQVEVLQKKMGSFINAWNGATEEAASLREEIQTKRDRITILEDRIKELEKDNSDQAEQILFLKRRKDKKSTSEEAKMYQDQINCLEKRMNTNRSKFEKSLKAFKYQVGKMQQELRKKSEVIDKLKKENRKMKSIQKELAQSRKEQLYMREIISSFEIKLINKMDMENNYDKMSEELAFKTNQIRKLEIQRMALEDVLRTTDMDALMNQFASRTQKRKSIVEMSKDFFTSKSKITMPKKSPSSSPMQVPKTTPEVTFQNTPLTLDTAMTPGAIMQ